MWNQVYRKPNFYQWWEDNKNKSNYKQLLMDLSEAQIEEFKEDELKVKKELSAVNTENYNKFYEARTALIKFYTSNSKEYKYIAKCDPPYIFYNNDLKYTIIDERADLLKVAKDKKEKEDQFKLEREQKNKAVKYLLDRGNIIGIDFNVDAAVETANQLAFVDECEKLKKANEYISFNGNNCDGPCNGWNPNNHRCDCGNRRVSFISGYGHSFENPCVIAEAY